ncbi:MAG: hypothetical protein U5K69_04130 [Balneolaceae bacterium]|nr:hypothetical protein [Balneolaceae bacterium]
MNLQQKQSDKSPLPLPGLGFGTALWYLACPLEGWRYSIKPLSQADDSFIDESIQTACFIFRPKTARDLLETGNNLIIVPSRRQLRQGTSRQNIYQTLQNNSSLWGGLLTRNDSIFVWSGFSLDGSSPPASSVSEEADITVQKQNNVILWLYHNSFTLSQESDRTEVYRLYLTSRIQQTNAPPFGKKQMKYHLLDEIATDRFYPVHFTFFNPLSADALNYRPLYDTDQDSIGAAYALPGQLQNTQATWTEDTLFWRSLFVVFALICIGVWGFFAPAIACSPRNRS